LDIVKQFWADVIVLAIALVFFNDAITSKFHTHGRGGGPKLIGHTKSIWSRVAFLLISIVIVVWLVIDLKRKLHYS
jgi:hypothetical protein